MADGERVTFTVEEYEKKPPTRNGTRWGRAKLKPGGWASCFGSTEEREMLYNAVESGATLSGILKITDEEKGWKNVEEVKPAPAGAALVHSGLTGAAKDVSIVRQVAWKVTGPIVAAMVRAGALDNDDGKVDIAVILENADFIAHHIELDILTEDPPEPDAAQEPEQQPDPEDDIPF